MSCEDIPSLLDLQKVKKHADDFGRLMGTGTGTSTNGVTGQVRPTYNKVIADMNSEFDSMIVDMNSEFDSMIVDMGFTRVGTFATGATLTNPRQTLLWDVTDGGDGQEYGWSGAFPLSGKAVPPGSTPLTTGGIAIGAWISRFDPELRIQVREVLRRSYAEAGFKLVDGSFEIGGTVATAADVLLYEATGIAYLWLGALPKVVPAGSTPASTGGIDLGAWVSAADSYGEERLLGVGAKIYRGSNGQYVQNGDTVPAGTTHLAVLISGKVEDVAMSPIASGVVSLLTETSATIGGTKVSLSNWFGALTNYQSASVADMISGLTIGGSTVKHNINQVWEIYGKWRVKSISSPMRISDFEPISEVYVHDFAQGYDITYGIRQCAVNGFDANILEGEWKVDSTFLNYDKLRIFGSGIPKLNSDYTLEGGTIIRGAIKTNSKHVVFRDFGVDLTQAPSGNDAIKATTTEFTDSYCNLENIIGVGRLPTDAYHAILLEGYNSLTYDNIHGVHNYFGIVIKCKNVQGGSARVTRYSDKGYYIKSDPTFGKAEKIQASKVMCEPADQAVAMDVYVQADGSSIEKVSIDQIDLSPGNNGVFVSAGNGTTIKSVSIGQVNGKGKTGRGFYAVTSGSGVIFDVQCDKMSLIEQEGRSFDASGNIRFLRMSDVFSSYTASTTDSVMSTAGFIAADVNETVLTSVTLCRNFSNTDLGTIRYLNPNGNNFLSNANVLLSGNPPTYGTASQTISGTTNEINVPVNKVNNEAFVTLNPTDNATITSMTVNRGVDCKFARNYRVSLLNNSAFTVSIPNNYAGKILTKGGATVTMAPNAIKCFIFGGSVFHEL